MKNCVHSHNNPTNIAIVEIYIKCIYSSIFTTVSNDEQESSRIQPKDDDNQSDYFADAETSSCGSHDLVGYWSDLQVENGKWALCYWIQYSHWIQFVTLHFLKSDCKTLLSVSWQYTFRCWFVRRIWCCRCTSSRLLSSDKGVITCCLFAGWCVNVIWMLLILLMVWVCSVILVQKTQSTLFANQIQNLKTNHNMVTRNFFHLTF